MVDVCVRHWNVQTRMQHLLLNSKKGVNDMLLIMFTSLLIMFSSLRAFMDIADELDPSEHSAKMLEKLIQFLMGSLKSDSMQKQEVFLVFLGFPFICEISQKLC